ncbi:tripartite tricarboxylate transporter substrate binding protein [Achromobacter mucicolens]|uniref:Bug family tripartite tricarboxylate transporter substrate binding protein n=1 Tax=Achromobacter mucicolens TaxID=1389922 RepID=UPI0020A3FE4E|nr:tripartite tricarboxylate transporter substrate binding protein [Achromobacter mucicolens]MCP2515561.1 tripartite tricarboxylate transporter substrate binding protein [Achromobacter mucicolens]
MNKRSFLTAACSAILAAMPVTGALAQGSYPDKPIRVIMPWAAGGPTDVVGRVVAVQMGEILGQPLVIETRAGASGTIGAAQVAKAPADGYTVLMNPSVQGIYPAQFKSLSFDPIKDFRMVGVLGTVPMVAVVPPTSKFKTFADLIEHARAQPGTLTFASPGVATLPHLAGELINSSTKASISHVGYRGSSPALTDVAGGHVDLMYAPLAPALPLIQSGKVVPLAVTTKARLADLPKVPTIAESVLPEFDIVTWYGMWVPKDTPEPIIAKLNAAMVQASKSPKVVDALKSQGTMPSTMSYQEAEAFNLAESARWIKVMKDANIQPE